MSHNPKHRGADTMLEKAARALAYSLANTGVRVDLGEGIITSHIFLAEDPTAAVLAVLKAIREPDEAMIEAAMARWGLDAKKSPVTALGRAACFTTMIDTITTKGTQR